LRLLSGAVVDPVYTDGHTVNSTKKSSITQKLERRNTKMNDLEKTIMDVIANCISTDKLYGETNLRNDLGVDSSEMVEIAVALEKALGVSININELKELLIIKQWVEYIRPLLSGKGSHASFK
jgi:acyl carrier protein